MEKSITRLVLAFSLLVSLGCATALAQNNLTLQQNAPDRYTVEKGDTLWGIAARFLKDPWRWPEIWRMNQEQLKNPHRIYPGDVIVLDKSTSPPKLSLESNSPTASVKLSPRVYSEGLAAEAIPAIPAREIEPFLSQPLVIEAGGLDRAPRIVATEESRVYLGSGGTAYVSGLGASAQADWQVFRPGQPLVDPDSGLTLGVEAIYLGIGLVVRSGEPATVQIVTALQEIAAGDRLIAMNAPAVKEYVPRSPSGAIRARVISLYNRLSTSEGGRSSIIALNKGRRDGLENGHVLALYRAGATVYEGGNAMYAGARGPAIQLPDERYGLVFVFRTFDAVSYALVMESSRPVTPGDRLRNP